MADPSASRPVGILAPPGRHEGFRFSALPDRPALAWPDGHALAVSVVLDLRAVEWETADRTPTVRPPGGRGFAPYPDFPRMSHREFGHRVGVFRLLEIMRAVGITPSAVVDVLTVERYGRLVDHLRPVVSEFLAGGLSGSRPITSLMAEDEERHYIGTTLERLASGLGVAPAGWFGVEHSESGRTPGLLAESGLDYVTDWTNDEQPYPMSAGALWNFPVSWELSDLRAMHERGVSADDYGDSIVEAADVLAAERGRLLAIHLHPWVSGQAFRADAVEGALASLRTRSDVWWASPGEIVRWCRDGGVR